MFSSLMNVFVKWFFFLLSIQVSKKVHLTFPLKLDTVSHPVSTQKYGNTLQILIVKYSINDKILYHVGFGVTSLKYKLNESLFDTSFIAS